jgi:1-acyl-sn-glycerol-3-phosphate acyltransferase
MDDPDADNPGRRAGPTEEPVDDPTQVTAELAALDPETGLPALRQDLRDFLPGLEPERQITDWGRSERMETLLDRTLYEFLYRHWFRVEAEGIQNVPEEGGALLVANHAGAMPPDAIMIGKAVRQEHARARPVHIAVDRGFRTLPAFGAIVTKVGGVPAHPANIHRLLFDEGQLVLAFPEGRSGPTKPLRERYRLRDFGRGEFVETAMRARVPIVPVAIVGAEEAQPTFAQLGMLRRLLPFPSPPLTPPLPLPAKFAIRFLEPVRTDDFSSKAPWRDRALLQTLSHDIRALIQENLLEMVAARRSVWLG